jgi:hypothetical protein
MFVPGGSEPDWGPAGVNPQPRSGGGGNNGNGGDSGNGNGGGVAKASVKIARSNLRSACRSGLKVTIAKAQAGKAPIVIRKGKKVVGKRTVKVPASGAGKFTVKFSKAGKKATCKGKSRSVKLTISAAGVKKAVTLKR